MLGNWILDWGFWSVNTGISFDYGDPTDGEDLEAPTFVDIHIDRPISKFRLKKFIDDNWDGEHGIDNLLKKLSNKEIFSVSEINLRIVEIKDNNPSKSYKEIVDEIVDEFKIENSDEKINSDSVKTAYFRTKEKIKSLAKYKKK